jgi:myo-inositol-1(or 4)-monophosphatase
MSDILKTACDAAREAGLFLKGRFGTPGTIYEKDAHELVTDLDRQAEAMIVSRIKAAFPTHGIRGEEGAKTTGAADYLWVIDPLDGTHNFIRGIALFGVCIGIVYKGEHLAGAVYLPMTDELFYAERGSGAYKNEEKIWVSKTSELRQATLAYDSSLFNDPPRIGGILNDCAQKVFNLRMLGSSACNLTALAHGSVDACTEFDDKPWDSAAGVAIIREAGGTVTTLKGAPFTFKDRDYLASNTLLHQQFLDIIKRRM